MNIEEIQAELESLVALMCDKGVKEPHAKLTIKDDWRFNLMLDNKFPNKPFDGESHRFFHADDAKGALSAARDYINALPSPEETVTREYLGKIASAVDYATKNAIDEEYVAPLRGVSCAMTDNLLTGPKGGGQ